MGSRDGRGSIGLVGVVAVVVIVECPGSGIDGPVPYGDLPELLGEVGAVEYLHHQVGVPYGDGTRQACDLCLGRPPGWEWAIEVKMVRMMGDNAKPNDNLPTHILSPYPVHRSAVTDCAKLAGSTLGEWKAILMYGYAYPDFPLGPLVEAFEVLAGRQVRLGGRRTATFGGLIHPVHQHGAVFAWEVLPG